MYTDLTLSDPHPLDNNSSVTRPHKHKGYESTHSPNNNCYVFCYVLWRLSTLKYFYNVRGVSVYVSHLWRKISRVEVPLARRYAAAHIFPSLDAVNTSTHATSTLSATLASRDRLKPFWEAVCCRCGLTIAWA